MVVVVVYIYIGGVTIMGYYPMLAEPEPCVVVQECRRDVLFGVV